MDRFDGQLQQIFEAYRASIDTPEPGPQFMPKLWERIDSRRNFAFRMKKLTQVFVGTSAFVCILMTGISVISNVSTSRQPHATYVDALAEAHPTDNLAGLGILARGDGSEASH